MENTRTAEEMLKEKLNILKLNLEKVGRDVLKSKYANAYKKLLQEINTLSNQIIHENVLCLDLASVKDESITKFSELVNKSYPGIKKCLLNADYKEYMVLINELSRSYAFLWCDNVMEPHVPGEDYIFNPFTLEKVQEIQ